LVHSVVMVTVLLLIYIILRPPTSTLFPYTTLFRSVKWLSIEQPNNCTPNFSNSAARSLKAMISVGQTNVKSSGQKNKITCLPLRSEEHTSELQSRENLVCRLLLEKKKHYIPPMFQH